MLSKMEVTLNATQPEMLAICGEKAILRGLSPMLYEQSLESLNLPRQYQTILTPSSVLQLIPDVGVIKQAMLRLYAHIRMGGVLVAPFMTLWREGMPLQREWENARVRERDGALLQRMGRVWYDPQTECEHTEDLYQVALNGEVIAVEHHRRSPASRSYTQEQALRLFDEAGFRDLQVWRGFTQEARVAGQKIYLRTGEYEDGTLGELFTTQLDVLEAVLAQAPESARAGLGRALSAASDGRATGALFRGSAAFLLAPVGDGAAAAASVETLLDDPPLADRTAAAARDLFDAHLAWPRIASAYVRLVS